MPEVARGWICPETAIPRKFDSVIAIMGTTGIMAMSSMTEINLDQDESVYTA